MSARRTSPGCFISSHSPPHITASPPPSRRQSEHPQSEQRQSEPQQSEQRLSETVKCSPGVCMTLITICLTPSIHRLGEALLRLTLELHRKC